jgi:hypothetical protein
LTVRDPFCTKPCSKASLPGGTRQCSQTCKKVNAPFRFPHVHRPSSRRRGSATNGQERHRDRVLCRSGTRQERRPSRCRRSDFAVFQAFERDNNAIGLQQDLSRFHGGPWSRNSPVDSSSAFSTGIAPIRLADSRSSQKDERAPAAENLRQTRVAATPFARPASWSGRTPVELASPCNPETV